MQSPWRSLGRLVPRWTDAWPPTATQWLIAVSALVFAVQHSLGESVELWGALSWAGLKKGFLWQPLTCLFLHSTLWTLLAGMLILGFAGRSLEAIVGRRHLVQLYLASGVAGALGHAWLNSFDASHGDRTQSLVMGAAPAAVGTLMALVCIIPQFEVVALGALRFKAWQLAALPLASAVVLAGRGEGGVPGGQPTAWLIGSLTGCLYVRQLGFGRRLGASEKASPNAVNASASLMHASLIEKKRVGQQEGQSSSSALPATARPAISLNSASRFTETERRMSPRQYIAERIDPILDKISLHGIDSLTAEDRAALEKGREKISQQADQR
jgi:membrane associated rhomboid family serine protease